MENGVNNKIGNGKRKIQMKKKYANDMDTSGIVTSNDKVNAHKINENAKKKKRNDILAKAQKQKKAMLKLQLKKNRRETRI